MKVTYKGKRNPTFASILFVGDDFKLPVAGSKTSQTAETNSPPQEQASVRATATSKLKLDPKVVEYNRKRAENFNLKEWGDKAIQELIGNLKRAHPVDPPSRSPETLPATPSPAEPPDVTQEMMQAFGRGELPLKPSRTDKG